MVPHRIAKALMTQCDWTASYSKDCWWDNMVPHRTVKALMRQYGSSPYCKGFDDTVRLNRIVQQCLLRQCGSPLYSKGFDKINAVPHRIEKALMTQRGGTAPYNNGWWDSAVLIVLQRLWWDSAVPHSTSKALMKQWGSSSYSKSTNETVRNRTVSSEPLLYEIRPCDFLHA